MSRSTKQDILDTLLVLLREQQLDEITVKELTERCGISRQAFYYHFSDIYTVVEWGMQRVFEGLDITVENWYEVLEQMGEAMRSQKNIVLNVYRSFERSYVEYHLKGWFKPVMAAEVQKAAKNYRVTEEQTDFVTELFTLGIISVVLSWLDHGLPSQVKDYFDDFYTVLNGSLDVALERLEQKNFSK